MIKYKKINKKANRRLMFLIILTSLICIVFVCRIFYLSIINNDYYNKLLDESINIYYGEENLRGNIYDRNMNLIVGNKSKRVLLFKSNISNYEKAILSAKISKHLNINTGKKNKEIIKEYLLYLNYDELESKVSEEIKNKYSNREIEEDEYDEILKSYIDTNEIKNADYKTCYIFYLLNNGYSFEEKVIKEDLTDKEYAYFSEKEKEYEGLHTSVKYERYYPYGSVFREILGSVSDYGLPLEEKDEYLKKGYILTDNVGINNLEKYYEEYLRGVREKYYINQFGEKVIIEEGRKGYDLVLNIDINLQKEVEDIIYEEIKDALKERNTDYLNKSYVIISNPKDGSILASSGKMILYNKANNKYRKVDNSSGVYLDAVTPGSIVKGASHLVGYTTGNLKIGYTVTDGCIKVMSTPKKCSWTYLGRINDITALKYSSNYYQFLTAIKVGKGNYTYNGPLKLDKKGFTIYRNMYNSFGLGNKTGIDLPYESIGFVGDDSFTGSLLDFAIGQYDTYTPLELMQYINTISSNGKRYALHYLKEVRDGDKVIYSYKKELLNTVKADKKYFTRIKLGFREVLKIGGTGYYFVDPKYKPAGKTGTSQSFIDTNHDGSIDTETITHTFGVYAPYDKPTFSMVVVTPDVATTKEDYISYVNKRISYKVSNLYFEKYK